MDRIFRFILFPVAFVVLCLVLLFQRDKSDGVDHEDD